jgi:hypothetical protein
MGKARDFVFSVSGDLVRGLAVPCLVLAGQCYAAPGRDRRRTAHLIANKELLDPWKGPEPIAVQRARVLQVLGAHTRKMMA